MSNIAKIRLPSHPEFVSFVGNIRSAEDVYNVLNEALLYQFKYSKFTNMQTQLPIDINIDLELIDNVYFLQLNNSRGIREYLFLGRMRHETLGMIFISLEARFQYSKKGIGRSRREGKIYYTHDIEAFVSNCINRIFAGSEHEKLRNAVERSVSKARLVSREIPSGGIRYWFIE